MRQPTEARISTSALQHNLARIQKALRPESRVMGIVKANCYGHESELCLPILRDAGIDIFGIATVSEARRLRLLGITERILMLTTPLYMEREAFPELNIEPLISDRKTATWLSAVAEASGVILQTHIYLDTGMTRNGAPPHEALELTRYVSKLPGLSLKGFASHFATSEAVDQTFARHQLYLFNGVYCELRDAGFHFDDVHIANSGGILNFSDSHYTLVRPGIILYGYHPLQEQQNGSGFSPVMSLYSVVSSVRQVSASTAVSYGARYHTAQKTHIATLPIGYGDGLSRGLTGKLEVYIDGGRYPVVGTICMDEVMVDLGPTTTIAAGDEVCLIGTSNIKQNSAWDIAAKVETIPYEITTMISGRVPRRATEETNHSYL